ncbi:hypothetical protein [Geomonas subterranea]|uniref:hypothetical protein n=1 Tax=Geomonas subterranea TaxID=2847989 RepID=UPI001CD2B48B|nr:hypothetical protein [Geomonas fuzhouensis]
MTRSTLSITALSALLFVASAAHAEPQSAQKPESLQQPEQVSGQAGGQKSEREPESQPVQQAVQKPAQAGEQKGTIFTLWPLIDYRESPKEGFSNLAILGPLFKYQKHGDDRDIALRPLFYRSSYAREEATSSYYLYPVATQQKTPEADNFEILQLYRTSSYRKQEPEPERERSTMLFPFYISGESERHGRYHAFFPVYGNIYDRFWRDEYHFVLFPLYGSTVKKGTTTRHYLWPFFATTSGDNESGFDVFPLYGQSHKSGVYEKRFVLWPFYTSESTGLNTDNPTRKKFIFPLYASTDSPKKTSRSYLWPFFGYTEDRGRKQEEVDYFWPFITKVRGEKKNSDSFLPFYSHETFSGGEKSWYLWPLYKHEELKSESFGQDQDRVLFFLYRDNHEYWPKDGNERRRTAMWPLFLYRRSTEGVSSLSFPALIEPILDKEGIEKDWAPLWRIYQRRWDRAGNSASSVLWNLFWHERRGEDLAYELFPFISYRNTEKERDLKFLKGLVSLKRDGGQEELSLFWLPFGLKWGDK